MNDVIPPRSPSRSGRHVLVCALGAALCATAAAHGPTAPLQPGTVTEFSITPDVVVGEKVAGGTFNGHANVILDETPLRAFAYGVVSGARARARVEQHHLFTIAPATTSGSSESSVVAAQFAGSVRVRGFLFAMGGATAQAGVRLQLMDVTGDTPVLVWHGTVAEYEAASKPSMAIGGSVNVNVQGGFPYVGASGGGGMGLDLGISPDRKVVRDEVDFAFPALVQRGRDYRLQLVLELSTQNRVLAATSIARFYSSEDGAPAMPNEYNTRAGGKPGTENTWLSILTAPSGGKDAVFGGRVGNFGLTKGDADLRSGTVLGFDVNIWEQGLTNPYNQLFSSEAGVRQRSDRFLAHVFGTPSGAAISPLTLADSGFMRVAQDDEEEIVDLPGVQLLNLVVTVDEDDAEADRRATNRTFERQLQSGEALVASCLPRSRGGDLEDVLDLVDRRIADASASGLPIHNAPHFQALARAELAQGNYRLAYARTRSAYLQLTRDL